MPGLLLTQGTRATCPHQPPGQASFTASVPRVKLGGVAVLIQTPPGLPAFTVSPCAQQPPVGPCVMGTFLTAATRVRVQGRPVILQDSQAMCGPTPGSLPSPLVLSPTQGRVKGR